LWLGIGYRSAWHLTHRIRALMAADPLLGQRLTGIIEADETYIGGKPRKRNGGSRPRRGRISGRGNGKPCVLVAAERGGRVRMEVVSSHGASQLGRRLVRWVDQKSTLVTDELPAYRRIGRSFGSGIRRRKQPIGILGQLGERRAGTSPICFVRKSYGRPACGIRTPRGSRRTRDRDGRSPRD